MQTLRVLSFKMRYTVWGKYDLLYGREFWYEQEDRTESLPKYEFIQDPVHHMIDTMHHVNVITP